MFNLAAESQDTVPDDYLPTVNNTQTQLIDNFVEGLERALDIKRTEISLADTWSTDRPDGADNQDLKKYLELVTSPFLRLTDWRDTYPLTLCLGRKLPLLQRCVLLTGAIRERIPNQVWQDALHP